MIHLILNITFFLIHMLIGFFILDFFNKDLRYIKNEYIKISSFITAWFILSTILFLNIYIIFDTLNILIM